MVIIAMFHFPDATAFFQSGARMCRRPCSRRASPVTTITSPRPPTTGTSATSLPSTTSSFSCSDSQRYLLSSFRNYFLKVHYLEFRSWKSPAPFAGQKFLERDGRRRTAEQHEPGALPPAHGAVRPQHDALRAARGHRLPGLPRSAAGQVGRVVLRARRAPLLRSSHER